MSISNLPDEELIALLKHCERSLLTYVDDAFVEDNKALASKYTEEQILEVFRLCLVKPGGKSWAPVWQVLLLLFQSAFSKSYTSEKERFMALGNYLAHRMDKDSQPVIYSFGIGSDITFDKAAADYFDVPIYMYDPTPGVAIFMEQHKDDKRLKFVKEGVFREETETKLYTSRKVGKLNSSLHPIHGKNGDYVMVRCRTLHSFMEENGHKTIDILKMDIEGVADDVIHQILDETEIRPKQIVAEFEIIGVENPITYLPRILDLMAKLKQNGYRVYNQLLTRKASVELIIVHQSLYDTFLVEK